MPRRPAPARPTNASRPAPRRSPYATPYTAHPTCPQHRRAPARSTKLQDSLHSKPDTHRTTKPFLHPARGSVRMFASIRPTADPTLRTRVLFIGNIDARAAHPWCACPDPRVPPARGRRSCRLGGRPGGSRDQRRAPLGSCAPHAVARASSSTATWPAAPTATGLPLPDRVPATGPARRRRSQSPRPSARCLSAARGSRRAARGSRSTCSGRSRCRPRRTWAIAPRPPARWRRAQ